jgi:hypothetical protein
MTRKLTCKAAKVNLVLLLGGLLVALLPFLSQASTGDALNYQEWKAQKVYDAEVTLEKARHDAKFLKGSQKVSGRSGRSSSKGSDNEKPSASNETPPNRVQARDAMALESVVDAQRNLKMAKELSVADYYLLYLRYQPADIIKSMSEKLSKKDLIEILSTMRMTDSEITEAAQNSM